MRAVYTVLFTESCLFSPLSSWEEGASPGLPDQDQLLTSADPKIAANKRLVYDFWREVLEAGHLDLANKYLTESYIQHNPDMPTGRAGFVQFFSKISTPGPIKAHIQAPLTAIVAEGDLVVLSFVQREKGHSTTWFDMFRIEDGKIAEHWDPAKKEAPQPALR